MEIQEKLVVFTGNTSKLSNLTLFAIELADRMIETAKKFWEEKK